MVLKASFHIKALLLILLLGWSLSAEAQIKRDRRGDNEERTKEETGEDSTAAPLSQLPFWKRLTYGGYFNAQFGQFTLVDISPLVGYRVTEDFTAGMGITYQYMKDKYYIPTLETYTIGGRPFAQYAFLKNFLAYGEYGLINYPLIDQFGTVVRRDWIATPLLGGGYRQAIGPRSYIQVMVLYNFNFDPRFSSSPWVFRIGFMI